MKPRAPGGPGGIARAVAVNPLARRDYEIAETLETGLALTGSEVRALRVSGASLRGAYVSPRNGQLWLVGAHIPAYANAARADNHDPDRPRRLLAHRREIARLDGRAREGGWTLAPLRLYFNEYGRAKLAVGVARGLRTYDKREAIKKREWERRKAALMGRGGRG